MEDKETKVQPETDNKIEPTLKAFATYQLTSLIEKTKSTTAKAKELAELKTEVFRLKSELNSLTKQIGQVVVIKIKNNESKEELPPELVSSVKEALESLEKAEGRLNELSR